MDHRLWAFSVEMLSEEIGMSTTHLYRKLKSLTHFSAKEVIKKYRIKKASLLLKNKEGNISEIMYEVGFSTSRILPNVSRPSLGFHRRSISSGRARREM